MAKTFSKIVGLTLLLAVVVSADSTALEKDTVALSLDLAEQKFVSSNLQLLAAKYNIGASKAAEIQAGLWSNPNISIEQNVYNQETGKYFDFTKSGNTEVQVQQLFLLAGKRDRQIKLAEINSRTSENTFEDLLRSLRFELRTDFFDLYFLRQSTRFYDRSIETVEKTVKAAELNYAKRSILLSEVLRLKSLLFTLQTERLGLVNRAAEIENDLRVLLRDDQSTEYSPVVSPTVLDNLSLATIPLQFALQAAHENRPDIKNADAAIAYEQTNLELQRALSVPDVTLGGRWSRAGSYIPDYFAISVSVDLPFFNRNQGNIEVSQNTLEADKAARNNLRLNVQKDVTVAYRKAMETDSLYRNFDKQFGEEYGRLVDGMVANYERRNIGIIEFTDFYESYRTSMLQLNQLQNDRIDAFENLNFVTGVDLIRYH